MGSSIFTHLVDNAIKVLNIELFFYAGGSRGTAHRTMYSPDDTTQRYASK